MLERTPSQPDNPNTQNSLQVQDVPQDETALLKQDAPQPETAHAHHTAQPRRRMNPVSRLVNHWFDRLLGAVSDRSLGGQEAEYDSGRTTRDYIWNTIGIGAFGLAFPLFTIVVTQLVGVEQAGMFSLAFVAGSVLMVIANYGVRPYQVSDINEEHSFSDYQLNRWLTCLAMLLAGALYCVLRNYEADMFTISMGVYFYKMFDGLGDVYEGRLQQVDKLYLAGVSQAFRSICVVVIFSIVLLITRNLAVSCVAMAIAAAASFIVLTLPLAMFETPKSKRVKLHSVRNLFVQCFPLFLALFLYTIIDYIPVFAMESVLSYDNELYYNSLYFPAQAVLLSTSLVYKPLLLRIANIWADSVKRRRFDLITIGILGLIVVFTLFMITVMHFIGIPLMSFFYGVDYEPYRQLSYIFVVAGGVTACIDFLYQIIAVLRRQRRITVLYVITLVFALFVPILLVNFAGLPGAIISYLIVMCILLFLIAWEYIRIRMEYFREEKEQQEENAVHLRPSEVRAARERSEQVHEKWSSRAASHADSAHRRSNIQGQIHRDQNSQQESSTQDSQQESSTQESQYQQYPYQRAQQDSQQNSYQNSQREYWQKPHQNPSQNAQQEPRQDDQGFHGRTPSDNEGSERTRPGRQ